MTQTSPTSLQKAALALLAIVTLAPKTGLAANLVDTTRSLHAELLPVGLDEVRWTQGFWAERVDVCYQQSVPSMWQLMKGDQYKPFLQHFLIVAGQAEGGHHGAKWNDGDFYKWLEAAIVAASVTKDPLLEAAIQQSVQAIANAQRDDGYLHTPVQIAQRNGDVTAKPFQDRHAFEMRKMVVDGGDDNQDRLPFAQQREAAGHAVRANYLNAGAADLYAETGDPNLLMPLEAIWNNMVSKKMYVTGACGALYDGASPDGSPQQMQITRVHQSYGRNYQLPNITAHNETCANIANLMWSWRICLQQDIRLDLGESLWGK